jgi:hypothetical protein
LGCPIPVGARRASPTSPPPGVYTDHPAVVLNRFGDGQAVYSVYDLESADHHRDLFMRLLGLMSGPFAFEVEAPKCVEVTLFSQEDRQRKLISLINFQKELPNIPVDGVKVRVRLDDRDVRQVVMLPGGQDQPFEIVGGCVEFAMPRLETFRMLAVDYQ